MQTASLAQLQERPEGARWTEVGFFGEGVQLYIVLTVPLGWRISYSVLLRFDRVMYI